MGGGSPPYNPLVAEVKVMDLVRREEVRALRGHVGSVQAMALHEEDATLVTAGTDG